MTPASELEQLQELIVAGETELLAARESLEAEVARLVLDHDGDGLGAARARVAELRDLLDARRSRAAVLRHRITQEGTRAA